jgi:hypothetical protein
MELPKRYIHILIPRICACYLIWKGVLAEVVKEFEMRRAFWII